MPIAATKMMTEHAYQTGISDGAPNTPNTVKEQISNSPKRMYDIRRLNKDFFLYEFAGLPHYKTYFLNLFSRQILPGSISFFFLSDIIDGPFYSVAVMFIAISAALVFVSSRLATYRAFTSVYDTS